MEPDILDDGGGDPEHEARKGGPRRHPRASGLTPRQVGEPGRHGRRRAGGHSGACARVRAHAILSSSTIVRITAGDHGTRCGGLSTPVAVYAVGGGVVGVLVISAGGRVRSRRAGNIGDGGGGCTDEGRGSRLRDTAADATVTDGGRGGRGERRCGHRLHALLPQAQEPGNLGELVLRATGEVLGLASAEEFVGCRDVVAASVRVLLPRQRRRHHHVDVGSRAQTRHDRVAERRAVLRCVALRVEALEEGLQSGKRGSVSVRGS